MMARSTRRPGPRLVMRGGTEGGDSCVRRRTAAERDDVAVRVLDVEVLRAPLRRGERSEDRYAARDALLVECLDAGHAGRGIEMLVLAAIRALGRILRGFLQVDFQSIQLPDRVKPIPWITEREAELPVVGDRPLQVIDQKLGSERRQPWLYLEVGHFSPL